MAAQKENQINLLPQKGFSSTTTGRVLLWILSSFRVTIIVTEIIVIAAFLSRFYLDARNSDLTDQISENKVTIENLSEFEAEFKKTQQKTTIFSSLTENDQYYSKQIDTITRSLPPDVLLSEIRFNVQNAEIEGFSPSERSIQQLVVNISDKDTYDNVGLVEINSTEEDPNLLKFTISSSYAAKTEEVN